MVDNPYDQFDAPASSSPSANPYDAFDAAPNSASDKNSGSDLPLSDVPGEALSNFIPSVGKAAESIYGAVRHPIDTATSLGKTALGGLEELDTAAAQGLNKATGTSAPNPSNTPEQQQFDALKDYYGKRYGSVEGFKRAVATDPAGVWLDLTALLSGGEGALARAPGVLGKVGDVAGATADALNPVSWAIKGAGKAAPYVGKAAAQVIGNVTTGAGANAIKGAFDAGQAGGDQGAAFLGNMRGATNWRDVVDQARDALGNMRADRNNSYRSGMVDISNDKSVLDFAPIQGAMDDARGMQSFKGETIGGKADETRDALNDAITKWGGLDPTEYHTPEGLDFLKKQVGEIMADTKPNTSSSAMAGKVYNSIKSTIQAQAPTYAKVMSDYSDASDAVNDIQRELSLGSKGNPATALRKLQSVMRDNVNTSFGQRADYANTLAENGADTLMPALSGQALSSVIPRGLAKYGDLGVGAGALALGHGPAALAMLPLASPRLMGEAAYGLGKVSNATGVLDAIAQGGSKAVPAAYEAGQAQGYSEGGHVHEEAAKADHEPSEAQIEAGNYQKGHVKLHGFDISIETPKGAARRGVGADGKPWENRHASAHYGYIKKSIGADGDHIDAYIGPHHQSERIYVADQIDPKTRRFDEVKVIFGARTIKEAKMIYDQGFSDGSGPRRRRTIHQIPPQELKKWLEDGDTLKPFAEAA